MGLRFNLGTIRLRQSVRQAPKDFFITSKSLSSVSGHQDGPTWRKPEDFRWFAPVQTRWKDNDIYGHMNNAVYHAIFDTIINDYLRKFCGLDVTRTKDNPIGFMVHTECTYYQPIVAMENTLTCGLAVSKLGRTSVDYKTALFKVDRPTATWPFVGDFHPPPGLTADTQSACLGEYTHVFVQPKAEKAVPTELPAELRAGLERISIQGS